MATFGTSLIKVKKFVDVEPTLPDALQVDDYCYVKYKSPTGDLTWYVSKIIAVRKKLCDPVQVEFKKTLSGVSSPLLLPSPTRAWVDLWSIRRDVPNTIQLDAVSTPLAKRACVRQKGAMNIDQLFKESIKISKSRHSTTYPSKEPPLSAIKKSKMKNKRRSNSSSWPAFEIPDPYTVNELGHIVVPDSCVEVVQETQYSSVEASLTPPKASSHGNTVLDAAHGLLQMTPPHQPNELPNELPIAESQIDSIASAIALPIAPPIAPPTAPPVMASTVLKSHLISWYMDKACVNTQGVCSRMPVWCLFCPMCGHAQQAIV